MLPPELIFDILSVSLTLHPRPVHVLRTCSHFYNMSLRPLYSRLQFKSCSQIERFLTAYGQQPLHIPYPPHVIELDVDNDTKLNLFMQLQDLFRSCSLASGAEVDQQGRLVLDLLRLRLHSLSQDPNPGVVYDALCVIKYGCSVPGILQLTSLIFISVHGSSSGWVATLPTTFLSQYVLLSSPGKCQVSFADCTPCAPSALSSTCDLYIPCSPRTYPSEFRLRRTKSETSIHAVTSRSLSRTSDFRLSLNDSSLSSIPR
jgi:hypothetical protein